MPTYHDSNNVTPAAHFANDDRRQTYHFSPNKTLSIGGRRFIVDDDFVGADVNSRWAEDLETANISGAIVSGEGAGVYQILSDNTSEGQAGQLTFGDILCINMSQEPIFEARVRLDMAAATGMSADERAVFGLGIAHATAEASLDIANHVWFRVGTGTASDLNLYVEYDDGTNDETTDTGIDIVDDTWTRLTIDARDLSAVAFYVDGLQVHTDNGHNLDSADLSNLSANTFMQPIFCYQRDAGTEVNALEIDWVRVSVVGRQD